MTINNYCKLYREKHDVKLRELSTTTKVKTISAFEQGRSTNINHLYMYVELSINNNDLDNFITGLKEVLTC